VNECSYCHATHVLPQFGGAVDLNKVTPVVLENGLCETCRYLGIEPGSSFEGDQDRYERMLMEYLRDRYNTAESRRPLGYYYAPGYNI
jgi:hypothetical protein